MIFGITQDYQIVVPLMVANLLSFAISKRYRPPPLYRALLHHDDVHLRSAAMEVQPERRTAPTRWAATCRSSRTTPRIADGLSLLDGTAALIVAVGGSGIGVVGRKRVADAAAIGRGAEPVSSLAGRLEVHVHPDHRFDVVLARFPAADGALPLGRGPQRGRDHARQHHGRGRPASATATSRLS